MNPAEHPSTTRRLGAPLDWNEVKSGPCAPLPIADLKHDGVPYMESLWEPCPIERAALLAGEKVSLQIQGTSHPVVRMSVTAPDRPDKFHALLSKDHSHNELAPALTLKLLMETPDEASAMVVLESLVLGVMLRYRAQPGEAAEFLDLLTERVIERMK